jgi:simple sugar transport system permease protein
VLTIVGSPVPSEFMLMAPYLVTIFAVAGLVGRVRVPAADGQPYIKS